VQCDDEAVRATAGGLVVVLGDEAIDMPANSVANAARSLADAKRTSLSIPRVASGLPAALAPVMRSPTSRTKRPATASSQRGALVGLA
jgi:hypothetical protein